MSAKRLISSLSASHAKLLAKSQGPSVGGFTYSLVPCKVSTLSHTKTSNSCTPLSHLSPGFRQPVDGSNHSDFTTDFMRSMRRVTFPPSGI